MHDSSLRREEVVASIARAAEIARSIARSAAANRRYEDAVWFEAQAAGAEKRAERLVGILAQLRPAGKRPGEIELLSAMPPRSGASAAPAGRDQPAERPVLRVITASGAEPSANTPLSTHTLSSRPTRALPPHIAASSAIGS